MINYPVSGSLFCNNSIRILNGMRYMRHNNETSSAACKKAFKKKKKIREGNSLIRKKSGIFRREEVLTEERLMRSIVGRRGAREAMREKDFAMRRHRSYISSRGPTVSRSSFFPALIPSVPSHGRARAQKRPPLRKGSPKQKKEPANTACNRVNCAAYAFISLFRDNLLIVSTKRDNPLVAPCVRAGFSAGL